LERIVELEMEEVKNENEGNKTGKADKIMD
jgi:hypothetical protein